LEQVVTVWTHLVETMTKLCVDPRPDVRSAAVVALQRILLAGDAFDFAPTYWFLRFEKGLLPLLKDLTAAVGLRSKDMPDAERTLRMAIGMLSKAFLHFLPKLHPLPEFPGLWLSILASMEQSMKAARSEEVTEVIPEALKNILLVMASLGVLTPGARGDLWEQTWKCVQAIAPNLSPDKIINQWQQQDDNTAQRETTEPSERATLLSRE